ncbi:MAG TPA: hypothetical protein IAB28_10400 [Candidatus Copromonas faecavium]|uniref:Uncharacterized protein n=1 Tax=Candidatus Copromonas faecavium (nom. illeg.) TaxID=2840740 RepID=A0A9D1A7P0_9FIRM|nr:hypothetical protein [Candidatus Copromonas faecavium]
MKKETHFEAAIEASRCGREERRGGEKRAEAEKKNYDREERLRQEEHDVWKRLFKVYCRGNSYHGICNR